MASVSPLQRQRNLILAVLLGLSAATWALLVWQSGRGPDMAMDTGLALGMSAPLFMGMWVLMMVAMMFPTAAPMILTFARISSSRQQKGEAFVPTWFFVSSYLAVWVVVGVAAYLVAIGLDSLGAKVMFLHENGARIGGGVLVLAGLYQLSPLKRMCLSKCRTPLSFLLTSWKEGYGGALRMGTSHGVYCFGCCWLLFVILFPLGIMNVAAMGLVTLLIFAEKSLKHGIWVGKAAGAGLLAFGTTVVFVPGAFPTSL